MPRPTLDELIVPAPPYRMARPVASLAATKGDFANDALRQQLASLGVKGAEPIAETPKQEAPPVKPEKTSGELAAERADAAEKIRDASLEATDPTLKTRGEELSGAAASVRKAASGAPAPAEVAIPVVPEVGSQAVNIKPPAPTGKYELPADAKAEMERIIAKQAELRAAGKEEEAAQWDVALSKYKDFKKEDKAKFYVEKKKAEAAKPVVAEKPAEMPATEAPKKLEGLEAERASIEAATGMPEAKRAALLKEYDEAIAKRDGVSPAALEPEPAPAPAAEVGSETIHVKPGESPDKTPEAAAPVVETAQKPAEPEVVPDEPKKVLGSLEDERSAVVAAQGMSEAKRASLLKEYDEAIAKRDAPAAEKPKVAPTADELEAFQKELKDKAVAAERSEQESRGAGMAQQAEEVDKAQKEAVVENYYKGVAQLNREAAAKARRAVEEAKAEDMSKDTAFEAELKRRSEIGNMTPAQVPELSQDELAWFQRRREGLDKSPMTVAEELKFKRIELQDVKLGQKNLEQRYEQIERGHEMADETDEQLKKEAEARIPRPDRMNMGAYLREGLKHVIEKSGSKTWLETLAPRIDAWENRNLALWNGMFQQRVQGKLDGAQKKVEEFQKKLEDSGMLSKLWYGARLRSWQKHAATLEVKVSSWNASRERFSERHVAFQREIVSRYDREMAPYKALVNDFASRLEVQGKVQETLIKKRDEALQKLAEAEAAGKKGRWFMGPRARQAVNTIKEQVAEMDRRISAADKTSNQYRKQIAGAQAGVNKWDLKKRIVAQQLELPELKGIERPASGAATSGPAGSPAASRAARPESAPIAAESDPSAKVWDVAKFIESWNGLGLERIEDAAAFSEYVAGERRRLNQAGPVTAGELLDFAQPYIKRASAVKVNDKQLKRDRKFFLDNAQPS